MLKDSFKNLTKKKESWNPWIGVVVGLAALFGSQLIIGIIFSIYPLLKHWSTARSNNWLTNTISIQFFYVLLAEALTVYFVYLYIKRYKGGLQEIGLSKPKWIDPVIGLMAFPAYLLIYFVAVGVATHLFPSLNVNEKQQLGFNNVHGALELTMTFISLVVLPPIAEEIVFRGVIFSSLKKKAPIWLAAVITSALFAAGHLPEGGSAGPLYIAALDTFCLSLVLVYIRQKTGRLYAGMTLHALKNTIAFIALFALHLN
jgi:membrane protease YdiL (CAAX protease family)